MLETTHSAKNDLINISATEYFKEFRDPDLNKYFLAIINGIIVAIK